MKVDVNSAFVLHYVILIYAAWSYCDSPNNTPIATKQVYSPLSIGLLHVKL